MTKTTTYGQKGGEGPTRGRKSETIEARFPDGTVVRKRVFFGQRWLFLAANEDGDQIVTAWHSEAEATEHMRKVNGDYWPVQLVALAEPIAPK